MIWIFSASYLFSGDKADFSGKWALNQEKSALDEYGAAFLPVHLTVTMNGNDITIQKTFKRENEDDLILDEKLTLDGKECKSEFWNSPRVMTANWSENGDTLNIQSKVSFQREGDTSELIMNEAWSLKEGGKALSVKHFSSSSWGERKISMVFDKKE
jgi:hypothetical protein